MLIICVIRKNKKSATSHSAIFHVINVCGTVASVEIDIIVSTRYFQNCPPVRSAGNCRPYVRTINAPWREKANSIIRFSITETCHSLTSIRSMPIVIIGILIELILFRIAYEESRC